MNKITSVGIIGLGSFGKFIATLIPEDIVVRGCDVKQVEAEARIQVTDLSAVMECDVVVMAVPLDAYQGVLKDMEALLRPETLLVDVCSVKVHPEAMIRKAFPKHKNLLLTHPLFGPLTVGRKLIVTVSSGQLALQVLKFCSNQHDMTIHKMTGEEHDKTMAEIHVLSFFIARGLSDMSLHEQTVATPTYQKLMELVDIDRKHSEELFMTVQHGNPFAGDVRRRVVKSFTTLEKNLRNSSKNIGMAL